MKAAKEVVRNSPGLSFTFRERREPLSFSWHRHREYELTYVREGTGTRYVGDDISSFAPGDLVLIGPDVPHAYQSSESSGRNGSSFVIVQFTRELFGGEHLRVREFRAIYRLLAHASRGLAFDAPTSELVRPLIEQASNSADLEKLLELAQILDLLARKGHCDLVSSDWHSANARAHHAPSPRCVEDILQYVFDHSTGPLSLARVADVAGVSVATLCRRFRNDLGCTFNEYVTRIRISQACTLLIQTALPVYAVSYQVGFENLSNFNRRFLRLKGMTPSAYRRAHRTSTASALPLGPTHSRA